MIFTSLFTRINERFHFNPSNLLLQSIAEDLILNKLLMIKLHNRLVSSGLAAVLPMPKRATLRNIFVSWRATHCKLKFIDQVSSSPSWVISEFPMQTPSGKLF